MTILIDDAGTGDLLWGVVIGAYQPETDTFLYDIIDVSFFKEGAFQEKKHFEEAARITLGLVERLGLKTFEKIKVCQGDILNVAAEKLKEQYGEEAVERVHVEGRAQDLIEGAYTDELRNLGYEPMPDRTERWGKSFWHMYDWVKRDPEERVKWAKTGFPNLKKFRIFQRR
ncbi:MAG: hypothetical protein NTV61_09830 [Candidatus Bathyarchaeota archaeon]|nr:hypothetical protein [Candidatus Bathyarchaeota archaeon]